MCEFSVPDGSVIWIVHNARSLMVERATHVRPWICQWRDRIQRGGVWGGKGYGSYAPENCFIYTHINFNCSTGKHLLRLSS